MTTARHICFLTGTLNVMAGAERMTAVVANALAEAGHTLSILSLFDTASCFPLHPRVHHEALFAQRPSFRRAYLATVAGIRRFSKHQRVDALVQVDTMLSLFTLPATAGLGIAQIAWEHCHFDEDLGKPASRLAARYCGDVVVLTRRDRQRWLEASRPRGNVVTIPNPLPFPFPVEPAARTGKTVLAMGRLVAAKGFDVLLHAWRQVAAEAPDWKLVIHGEGEARGALEALIAQLGLRDSVSLPGVCLDGRQAYEQASVFCLSSRYEGFGLVLIEAIVRAADRIDRLRNRAARAAGGRQCGRRADGKRGPWHRGCCGRCRAARHRPAWRPRPGATRVRLPRNGSSRNGMRWGQGNRPAGRDQTESCCFKRTRQCTDCRPRRIT